MLTVTAGPTVPALPIPNLLHRGPAVDLLCFSHLRWDFVFQRPHHLLTRAARAHRVFFIEEPVYDATVPHTTVSTRDGVAVVVAHLRADEPDDASQMTRLLDGLVKQFGISPDPIVWYYTPMALPWTEHLHGGAAAVVYDCMDHLAGFKDAPIGLIELEDQLLRAADVVFTGGRSLFEAKRTRHPSVHCFPSSVDVGHFGSARLDQTSPADQALIPRPRIGYFGVLDERIDWPMIRDVAAARPDWQLIFVGPTAKVEPQDLPQAANIHYLGQRPYQELPAYLASWDAAIMPFARNEATRYISPTKTPEYLAGGRPVASTSIRDVVHPFGDLGLVHIGDSPEEFIVAITRALDEDLVDLWERADVYLRDISWDRTWSAMQSLIDPIVDRSRPRPTNDSVPATASRTPSTLVPGGALVGVTFGGSEP
jgi:UDP-galactopyranose mutase